MKTIVHASTLAYYDGVQLFEARDPIGGHYIASLIGVDESIDRYLVVGVRPIDLRGFRAGSVDLRDLILESAEEEWFTADCAGDLRAELPLNRQSGIVPEEHLPASGFTFQQLDTGDEIVRRAIERNKVVIELSLEPPESVPSGRIGANQLGQLLVQFQNVLKHAYHREIRGQTKEQKLHVNAAEGYLADVVAPARAGSFTLTLEPRSGPDLFGSGEIVRALKRWDEIFEISMDPIEAQLRMGEHKGHLAASYLKLIEYLSVNSTGLWYSWVDPMEPEPNNGGMSNAQAKELMSVLSQTSDLGHEPITLIGEFEKVSRRAGDWGLLTEDGIKSGHIDEGGPTLDGLEVGRVYRFECDERILLVDASGRERRILYLREIHKA